MIQEVIFTFGKFLHLKDASFFETVPHHSEIFKSGKTKQDSKTPTPIQLRTIFADEQLQSLVRNIVDLEIIEADLLSLIVVTDK
jgi:hypothetical protein